MLLFFVGVTLGLSALFVVFGSGLVSLAAIIRIELVVTLVALGFDTLLIATGVWPERRPLRP